MCHFNQSRIQFFSTWTEHFLKIFDEMMSKLSKKFPLPLALWSVLNKNNKIDLHTQGFLTPDSFHSTSLATWGSSWGSKEAKFIKEFDFLGFSRCFSARIEKSSKTSKIQPNCVNLRWFFEVCSILAEKQRLKPRKLNSLIYFASLDAQFDPQVARLVEKYPVLHFVLKSNNSSALYNFILDL